jgi:betaine-aldehyde dehydrogenase
MRHHWEELSVDRLKNHIDGKSVPSQADSYSDVIDPCTGEAYCEAPVSGAADIDAACQAAKAAFRSWRLTTPGERSVLLFRAADALAAHADELIAAEARNTGKPLGWLREEEFPGIVEQLRFYAAAARDLRGLASGQYVTGFDSSLYREPVGVCGQVSPWNYPLNMALWKFGPALAAGNTVVLKPSDTTPVTTVMAAEFMAGLLPPGVLNIVCGDRDTGRLLVAHPIPAIVSVTGSVRAGREVATSAGQDLKRVSLELGGKAPALVFSDADLAAAADGIIFAAFVNAGQDCEAVTRVLVEESVRPEFTEMLVSRARVIRFGPPDEDGVTYGPLNNAVQLDRVAGFVGRIPAHASILTGGHADRRNGGYYFEPTIIDGLKQDDEMIQQEVFGPVLAIQGFSGEAEALELANGVEYGLAGSVWSTSHDRVLRLSRDLECGKVWVNCHLVVAAEMPNSGVKASGHGNDLSVLAIEEYTRVKHVMSKLAPLGA